MVNGVGSQKTHLFSAPLMHVHGGISLEKDIPQMSVDILVDAQNACHFVCDINRNNYCIRDAP